MANEVDFIVKLIGKTPGMDKVEKSLRKVVGATSRYLRGTKKAEKGTGRFRDATGKLREANGRFVAGQGKEGGIAGAMKIMGGNLMTEAVMKTLGLAKAVGVAGAEMITFGQNTRLALTNLAKHGAEPEKLFDHARALAVRFGLDVMDTSSQYKKFLALQFSPKAADSMIRMGADLQALGNSAEDVQGVFMALGQIKGKGKLQAEEMLQLAERGVSGALVQEEIGKLMGGKTTDEVQKAMQAGKVSADIGLQAIENAINRKLGQSKTGESGAKFADTTISGMMGRIKSLGQDAGLTLVEKMTAPLTKATGKGLDALQGFLSSPEGAATMDKIAGALGRAADFMLALGDAFAGAFGDTFEQSVKPMWEVFGAFGNGESAAASLGKALGQAGAFAVAAASSIALVATGVMYLVGPIWTLSKALVEGLIDPLAKMAADFFMWFERLGEIFDSSSMTLGEKALAIGKAVVTGIAGGIWSLITLPADALASMGSKALDALKGIFQIASPSRATERMGVQLGRGLMAGVDSTQGSVAAASAGMARASLGGVDSGFAFGPQMSGLRGGGGDGGGFGPSQFSFSLTQQISGGESAEETGRVAAREARREFEAMFRQLALEV